MPEAVLLYPTAMHRTAKYVAKSLEIPAIRLGYEPRNVLSNYHDLVINWGCGRIPIPAARILNRHARSTGDKLEFLLHLNAADLPVPIVHDYAPKDQEGIEYVIRDRRGWGGRDLLKEVPIQQPIWVQWLNKSREFRIYFAKRPDGEIKMALREKTGDKTLGVWNRRNGFVFSIIPDNDPIRKRLFSLGRKLIATFSLDFGAFDVILDNNDLLYTLEANTAPRLEADLYPGQMLISVLREWVGNVPAA